MVILGLTLGHDAAVSIVVDGKLVSSISCERIYREKKTSYIDWVAIDYILSLSTYLLMMSIIFLLGDMINGRW